jgi:hypothetical protein
VGAEPSAEGFVPGPGLEQLAVAFAIVHGIDLLLGDESIVTVVGSQLNLGWMYDLYCGPQCSREAQHKR